MESKASAVWKGGLKDGSGTISSDSGVLSGTNPEELIAAAHAGCFSMALSAQLGEANLTAEHVSTTATVTLEQTDGGFAVTKIHLDVTAKIPGAAQEAFRTAANNAKTGCPISKLMNAEISMNAVLES